MNPSVIVLFALLLVGQGYLIHYWCREITSRLDTASHSLDSLTSSIAQLQRSTLDLLEATNNMRLLLERAMIPQGPVVIHESLAPASSINRGGRGRTPQVVNGQ